MPPETLLLLPSHWEVPAAFHRRLGSRPGRQRMMQAEGHLLLVLHRPPARVQTERRGRFLWRSPEGQWQSNDLGSGAAVLQRHLSEISDQIDRLERLEDDAATADAYFDLVSALVPLHRTLRNLHTVLQEARQACPEDRDLINARDLAYELERSVELLERRSHDALQYLEARKAEEQLQASHRLAVAAHRLNLMAAFFLPLATLATVLAVPVPTGLEQIPAPWGLVLVVVVGLGSGLILMGFLSAAAPAREPRRRKALQHAEHDPDHLPAKHLPPLREGP